MFFILGAKRKSEAIEEPHPENFNDNLTNYKLSCVLTEHILKYNFHVEDRVSFRKEILMYDSSNGLLDFWVLFQKKHQFLLPPFIFDIIDEIAHANHNKSLMEMEKSKTERILYNRNDFDISIVDLPYGMKKRYCTLVGCLFYFLLNAPNLRTMVREKLQDRYETHLNMKFRNIIFILCDDEYACFFWKQIIETFIEKFGSYILEKFGKTLRLCYDTNYLFDLEFGRLNELCFLIQIVDVNRPNQHIEAKGETPYKVNTVVTIEECSRGIQASLFNKTQVEFHPDSLHYVYLNNYWDNHKLLDIENINKNSIFSRVVGLEKFESKKEKAFDFQSNRELNFRLYHCVRGSNQISKEIQNIISKMNYKEISLKYISSNLFDEIVEFNTLEKNFDMLCEYFKTYFINLPDRFRQGFRLNDFENFVSTEIDLEENETKKEKMILGKDRMMRDQECCICFENCQVSTKRQKCELEETHDLHNENDFQIFVCCLNKIHSGCMSSQIRCCPLCRNDSIDAIRASILQEDYEEKLEEKSLDSFLSYLKSNPYRKYQKNPKSLISIIQQTLNCLLDYGKKYPDSRLKIIMICRQNLLNKFYQRLSSLVPNNSTEFMKIYRFDSIKNIHEVINFENSVNLVNILIVRPDDEFLKVIRMDKVDLILEVGNVIRGEDLSKILSASIGVERKKSNSFCYIKIDKN